MGFKRLLRPGDHHKNLVVRTAEEYRQRHTEVINGERERGSTAVEVQECADPVLARVASGSWVTDCTCNATISASPEWRLACCFGCGDVYADVVFPTNWQDIEALLVHRPQVERRWSPGEPIEQVRAKNLARGWRVD